jgi:hypothetical protein
MAKYIAAKTVLKDFSLCIHDKLSYDLTLESFTDHLNSIYVCRRFAK